MEIKCPKCELECEGESVDQSWIFECECECGCNFSYDDYRNEYYDEKGNILKGGVSDGKRNRDK